MPALQVSFVTNYSTGHALPLKVPLSVCSFMSPIALPAADFESRWSALDAPVRFVPSLCTTCFL